MRSILLGLTRQYFNAFRTVAAPLWLALILLLVGGPWFGQVLMVAASGGELDVEGLPRAELRVVCHLLATLFFGFGVIVGLFQKPKYVFRLPVSSRLLVTWQFVAAAMTIALSNGALTIAYQLLFGATLSYATTLPMIAVVHLLIWLVWLFVPATIAGAHGNGTLFGAPMRRQLAFAAVRLAKWFPIAAVLVAYVVMRTNSADETIFWQRLTGLDLLVLLAISGIVWKLTANEVERQRHGDVNYRSLMERDGDSLQGRLAHQNVPAPGQWSLGAAHRWYHWQAGRTLLLMGTIFVVPLLLVIFLGMTADRDGRELEGLVAMLTMMPMLGSLLVGAALGFDTVSSGTRREMKKHLAVLPVSDRDLARTMLATFAKTLCGLWSIVFVMCGLALAGFCAAMGSEMAVQELRQLKMFKQLGFGAVPLQLLFSIQLMWTVGGLTAALAYTGREQFFSKVILAFVVVVGFPGIIGVRLFVPEGQQDAVLTAIVGGLALVTLGLVGWSYRRARQRELLGTGLVHAAFAVWAVEAGLSLIVLPVPLPLRLALSVLLGLGVLPITMSPLAVAWNRHR